MKDYKDINLKTFLLIQDLLAEPDDYTALNIIDLVYGVDSANMPVSELKGYSIEFLKTDVPNVKIQDKYTINGTEYDSNFNLTVVTTAQFIDYQNYLKEEKPQMNKLLSVFFIPAGHKYNDGYDMAKVQDDLMYLDVCTVKSAAFFFEKQLMAFASLFQYYLTKSIKKMKLSKEKKKEVLQTLGEMDLASLVSYRLSLNTVK